MPLLVDASSSLPAVPLVLLLWGIQRKRKRKRKRRHRSMLINDWCDVASQKNGGDITKWYNLCVPWPEQPGKLLPFPLCSWQWSSPPHSWLPSYDHHELQKKIWSYKNTSFCFMKCTDSAIKPLRASCTMSVAFFSASFSWFIFQKLVWQSDLMYFKYLRTDTLAIVPKRIELAFDLCRSDRVDDQLLHR